MMSGVACHVSCVTCCVSRVMCHVLCVKCHVSRVACHVSCVTCHVSRVACHVLHVTCYVSLFRIFCIGSNTVPHADSDPEIFDGIQNRIPVPDRSKSKR